MSEYIHGTDAVEQQRLALMNSAINENALRELGLRGGERILDVGCGLAQFTSLMAAEANSDHPVIGVERDDRQLTEARRLLGDRSGIVELRQGDATQLPLHADEWANFDLVHSRFLLEHLTDPQIAVEQMVRAARPNGRIVLQDDDHDVLRLWPSMPDVQAVWQAYADSYERTGKDGFIGRKLSELLVNAGAKPVKATWLFYGACAGQELFEPLIGNLIGVIQGAAVTIVAHSEFSHGDISSAIDQFEEWRKLPYATLWYSICWAEGVRADQMQSRI